MSLEEITEDRIRELVSMPKKLVGTKPKSRREDRFERTDYEATGEDGRSVFRIYLRRNLEIPEDFSCGIRWMMPSGETLTLARYNGSSHVHGEIRYECHIHRATEDAIRRGWKPEKEARRTERYRTLEGSHACLLEDFHISGLSSPHDPPDMFS